MFSVINVPAENVALVLGLLWAGVIVLGGGGLWISEVASSPRVEDAGRLMVRIGAFLLFPAVTLSFSAITS